MKQRTQDEVALIIAEYFHEIGVYKKKVSKEWIALLSHQIADVLDNHPEITSGKQLAKEIKRKTIDE